MKQAFNLLLAIFLAQLIACGDKDVDIVSGHPDQEEMLDPSKEPQDTLPDIFEVECANHSPQLYLSVTDKDANPIYDYDYSDTSILKEGHIAIRKVNFTENDADHAFALTVEEDKSRVSIYPETIHAFWINSRKSAIPSDFTEIARSAAGQTPWSYPSRNCGSTSP